MDDFNRFKSGGKDPRPQMRETVPYSPRLQADQQQFYNRLADEYGNTIPLAHAKEIANQSIPSAENTIRVEYSYFAYNAIVANSVLLVPRNATRSSLIVCNNSSDTIIMSFGRPINPVAISSQGIALPSSSRFEEHSGLVGIDDIYVCQTDLTHGLVVVAFEGTPALLQV